MPTKDAAPSQPLQNPDQLNNAIRLTSASSWILLAVLTLCIGAIVIWSMVGRLLVYVHGPGVLELAGGDISVVEATATGEIKEILVQVGDSVKAGDTMFKVDLTAISAQNDGARKTLTQQQAELDSYTKTSDRDIKIRKENLDQQIKFLNSYIANQHNNESQLSEIYKSNQDLFKKGLIAQPVLQQSFERLIDVQQDIGNRVSQIADLKLQQIEFEDSVARYVSELNIQVAKTQGQLNDLDAQLQFGGAILAPSSGVVTELATEVGRVVDEGVELGAIQSGDRTLDAQGYMPIGKGKQVEVGMLAEISPTSVERNIYGSIRGTVTRVSRLPVTKAVLENRLGNTSLADQLMAQGAPIGITLRLEEDSATESGLRWTSSEGPPVELSAGTTVDVRVLTEQRRPITLLLPVLQTWFTVQ